jgi:heptaprenyl diphosphate synthase
MNRREAYENIFSARALFAAGLLIMPSLVFNPSTEFRMIQFLFFCLLVLISGKKINFIFTILIIACIVAFNLIIPYGRVLFSIGAFKITSGALKAGIHRAVTLEALVMLSKVTIRQDLKIPGAFGELLGESLRLFSVIMNRKNHITGKNLIEEIDSLMLELSGEDIHQPAVRKGRTKPAGYIILAITIILSWLPWFR